MLILDFGSGNTCKNDTTTVRRMIDALAETTNRKDITIKWQLFTEAGENVPLNLHCFEYAYKYAAQLGFKTTASVFDMKSLHFLLSFDVPFVKLANCDRSAALWGAIPRRIPIVQSFHNSKDLIDDEPGLDFLCCVSKYPAQSSEYITSFSGEHLSHGISDHTDSFALYQTFSPITYECHYKLDDSTGLDAGPFAKTPEQLREIL